MPLTVDEVLEERRKTASRKAVVVESERDAEAMRQVLEEGVQVFPLGHPVCARRFDLIIMLARPRSPAALQWFETSLLTCLHPEGKVEWLVARLSLA